MKNEKIELTLLASKELFDEKKKLDVIKKYGTVAAITDLAILTGGYVYNDVFAPDFDLKTRPGFYSTQTCDDSGDFVTVDDLGDSNSDTRFGTDCSIRPVLISNEIFKEISANAVEDVWEIEYGEYPQYAPDDETQQKLTELLNENKLNTTDKTYSIGHYLPEEFKSSFNNYVEYEYYGKKYIHVRVSTGKTDEILLSNHVKYCDDDYVWIEVSPVRWLVDRKSRKLVSKLGLVAGVVFNDEEYTGLFSKTKMKEYLDESMLANIIRVGNIREKANNPYGLIYSEVSEEDIIAGCIESDLPLFIHGRSGDGKSARVKEIDPNLQVVYLAGASPESLNGKAVYTGNGEELIHVMPPWLKKLKAICDADKDNIHIVFFDEITNALPSIQGIAFNIVLEKEVNGIWQLPENSRIVAAGNDMEESLAANPLAAPFFGRFAHAYIMTDKEKWLKWAIDHDIHPAIYAYIAFDGDNVLRTEYDGVKPNADPRKWEKASKMLYTTKNPEMLRSLVGDAITKNFVAFCRNTVITLDDVLSGKANKEDISKLNSSERYATIMTLSLVDDENFREVREFVTMFDPEYVALFDSLWSRGNDKRTKKLMEIREEVKKGGLNK